MIIINGKLKKEGLAVAQVDQYHSLGINLLV